MERHKAAGLGVRCLLACQGIAAQAGNFHFVEPAHQFGAVRNPRFTHGLDSRIGRVIRCVFTVIGRRPFGKKAIQPAGPNQENIVLFYGQLLVFGRLPQLV